MADLTKAEKVNLLVAKGLLAAVLVEVFIKKLSEADIDLYAEEQQKLKDSQVEKELTQEEKVALYEELHKELEVPTVMSEDEEKELLVSLSEKYPELLPKQEIPEGVIIEDSEDYKSKCVVAERRLAQALKNNDKVKAAAEEIIKTLS